jgi:hypothetical protein
MGASGVPAVSVSPSRRRRAAVDARRDQRVREAQLVAGWHEQVELGRALQRLGLDARRLEELSRRRAVRRS